MDHWTDTDWKVKWKLYGPQYYKVYEHWWQAKHDITADRSLWIDYIKMGNNTIQAENSTVVKYDKGENQKPSSYFDGQDVISGQEYLPWAGALRFEVDVNPIINVTKEFEPVMQLNPVKYPNGTVIKDEEGKLWLMETGSRRLIEDEITLQALGLNKEKAVLVVKDSKKYEVGGLIGNENIFTNSLTKLRSAVNKSDSTSFGLSQWKDYIVETNIYPEIKHGEVNYWRAGLQARVGENGYYQIHSYEKGLRISKVTNGVISDFKWVAMNIAPNTWHSLKISSQGDKIKFYFNNQLQAEVTDSSITSGKVGISSWGDSYSTNVQFKDTRVIGIEIPRISSQEFKGVILEGEPIKIKYANGTIISDISGNQYLMDKGMRRLIPDKTTADVMDIKPQSTITIRARADMGRINYLGNIQEHPANMKLVVDGKVMQEWIINHTDWREYSLKLPDNLSNGEHKIDVVFDNDFASANDTYYSVSHRKRWRRWKTYHWGGGPTDTNLYVDNIRIQDVKGERIIHAEDKNTRYDRGINYNLASYQDNIDVIPGQEGMYWAGALRFKTTIEPTLKLNDAELQEIPEGSPLPQIPFPNMTLIKGSGSSIYLMMNGQKKYIPDGITYESYGLNPNSVKTISDEELINIPTDDGLPRIEYYKQESYKVNVGKMLADLIVPFIPGIGQIYMIANGLYNLSKKDYVGGALGFLGGLGGLSNLANSGKYATEVGKLAKLGKIGKIGEKLNQLNQFKTISTLTKLADTFNKINTASIALTGNDLSDGSGRKIQGVNRFLAGLQISSANLGRLPTGLLNSAQTEFLSKNIGKIADYYQKGVMITGKEKIFSGKEVSDEERISLAGNLLGAHIKRATDVPNTPITEAIRKGLSSFVTDMVVETPINLTKDSAWLAEKGARILVEGAIKSYSSILNTNSPNQATIDNIVKGITLPVNVLNDAMQIYNQAGRWLTIEQVKNIVSRFFSDKIDKGEITIPKIENPGQSTTTFAEVDEKNNEDFKAEVQKAKEIITEAVKQAGDITTAAGQSLAEHLAKDALKKAGYSAMAATLNTFSLFSATGAFDATAVGNPTDVKGLLRREGNKFVTNTCADIVRNNSPYVDGDVVKEQIKNAVERNIQDYLEKIKYNQLDVPQRLVFPGTIKFEFVNGQVKIIEK